MKNNNHSNKKQEIKRNKIGGQVYRESCPTENQNTNLLKFDEINQGNDLREEF